jgi:cell division protein FtsI (penicillin-binding protein 3)
VSGLRQVSRGRSLRSPATPVGRWVRARFGSVALLLVLLMSGVAWQAYGVQIEQGKRYRALADRQQLSRVEIPAPRGKILDATGSEPAATAHIDSVFANPREVRDVAATAERLAAALDLDVREVEARLAGRRQFAWIERHVTGEEAAKVRALKLAGVGLMPEPRRFYPGRMLAGPVLGFAGIDGKGLSGLELTLDAALTGERASVAALRDASGNLALSEAALEPRPGASVRLTIDRTVQFTAERALAEAVKAHDAEAGTAVVIDVATGAVLAMATVPSLDPNTPGAIDPKARNRAVTDVLEIGSVMKVFTAAAALDAGTVRPDTAIDCERGKLKIGRATIRDTHEDGVLSVGGVIKRSSNVGAVKIARSVGKERLYAMLRRLGFGQKTGIELPGEETGVVRPAERWRDIELATIAYGYGVSVTPLQVTAALAAIGNHGRYNAPYLVEEVEGAERSGKVLRHRPAPRQVMSPATADAILPMLASVFDKGKDGGTAGTLDVDGFRVGGKSGTSHKLTGGRYGRTYLSSFAGLAPIAAPRIAVLVVIDEPRNGTHYGALVAGPAWSTIVSETLRHLGVPADAPAAPLKDEAKKPAAAVRAARAAERGSPDELAPEDLEDGAADGALLPDFAGMGLAQALALAKQRGIRLSVSGSGRVVSQTPAPGPIVKPAECRLVLAPHRPAVRAPRALE